MYAVPCEPSQRRFVENKRGSFNFGAFEVAGLYKNNQRATLIVQSWTRSIYLWFDHVYLFIPFDYHFSPQSFVKSTRMNGTSEESTIPPAPRFRSVLVTGAAGFIGYHVLEHLACSDAKWMSGIEKVVGLDRLDYSSSVPAEVETSPNKKREVVFVKGDITSPNTVLQVLKDHCIDTIVHLAAQTHVDNSFGNSFTFTLSNVLGTHVLLEACKQVHPQVVRFLHVSTDEVYGENKEANHEFVESDALEPTNPYSATKAAAESIVKAYHRSFGIPVVIARPNNVYGPRQFPEKVIPKFIRQLEASLPLTIHGGGKAQRSFLHVTDVAKALTDYILIKGIPGEVYNIGSHNVISILELANDLCRVFEVKPQFEFVIDRAYNDQRYHISSRKLREELGWPGPQIPWEQGLRSTVQWYRDHQGFWPNEKAAIVAHPRLGEENTTLL